METFGSTRIAGIGAFLPEQRISTDELMHEVNCRRFRIPEDYISRYIGIIEKRVASPDLAPSDLAVLASEVALKNAGINANEIDLIIYAGITRDFEEPATAHNVQNKLGATKAVCMDVSNACIGFMTGLWMADKFMANGGAESVLICTGEMQSRTVNEFKKTLSETTDKEQFKKVFGVLTVGDAGGAIILQRKESHNGLQWIKFKSEGTHSHLCTCERTPEGVRGQMIMQDINTETLNLQRTMIKNTYQKLGWDSQDVSKVYSHQIGKRTHQQISEIVGVPLEKWITTYPSYGNLTSATFPVCMHLEKPLKEEKILLLGAGSGISVCQGGLIF